LTDFSEELTASIIMAGSTQDSIYQTARRNIPEDSQLHIRRRENQKFYLNLLSYRVNIKTW
jgi:hypothetical protein